MVLVYQWKTVLLASHSIFFVVLCHPQCYVIGGLLRIERKKLLARFLCSGING